MTIGVIRIRIERPNRLLGRTLLILKLDMTIGIWIAANMRKSDRDCGREANGDGSANRWNLAVCRRI